MYYMIYHFDFYYNITELPYYSDGHIIIIPKQKQLLESDGREIVICDTSHSKETIRSQKSRKYTIL